VQCALELGADRFILKPQEPEVFLKIITDFLKEVENKTIHKRKIGSHPETVILKEYNEVLIRKIEDKMLQTEKTEKELRNYAQKLENEILEHKKSEALLAESEAKYRELVTQSPDGIFIVDLTGKFISVNKAICENLKYTEEELLSMKLMEVIPEQYHAVHRERLTTILKGESLSSSAEYEVAGKDGITHFVEVLSVPYYRENKLIGFQGIARDITQRKRDENLLKDSEEKYRRLFENVQDVYYEIAFEGTILEVSPSIEVLSKGQYTRNDLIGKSMYDFYAGPGERDNLIEELKENGILNDHEITLLNRDGSGIPCSLSSRIVFNMNGKPEKIIGSMRDITERKKTHDALRESEELYRSIYENSNVAILLTSPDGIILSANDYACKLFGRTEKEMCEAGRKEIVDVNDTSLVPLLEERASRGKATGILTFLKKDGSGFQAEVSSTIFKDRDGNLRTSMVIRDLTEQYRAEDAIRKSEARFRSYFESAVAGIAITSPVKGWLDVNTRLIEILGYTKDELNSKSWSDLTHPEDLNLDIENFERVLNGEIDAYSIEKRFIRKDLTPVWTNMSVRCVRLPEGRVDYFIALIFDISKRKKIEEELINSKLMAEESDRLKTAFLQNISHEIRTPLNAIVGFSSLLLEPDLDDASKFSFINTIMQSSDHLLEVMNDIIEISNIEAGIVKYSKDEVKINQVLKRLHDQFLPRANEKKISFTVETSLSDEVAVLVTDKTKLVQILSNLLNNAFKFTDKGMIKFGYIPADRYINFFVSDTGIGINDEQHQKIFDRFYQVEHSLERPYEGTGLGLSISKAFVELMGGQIWIESDYGKGSTFYFSLPFSSARVEIKSEPESVPTESVKRPAVILVAEDDENNYKLLLKFLENPNLRLVRARNGREAVSYCESGNDVDLVLMDLKMPEMDGYEATTMIKKICPNLHVIAQTAFITDKEKAYACGCSDFIAKPFKKSDILGITLKYLNM
jgi:PAS domain S-box-containing protein